MNELILELTDISPRDFFGEQSANITLIKKYFPKLKIVARGSKIKAYGDEEVLEEFDRRMAMLFEHYGKYNKLDENVIERVLTSHSKADYETPMSSNDILVHGVGGKIIKPQTANQRKLVALSYTNDMVFAVGPAGTGKTYTGVALAVKALKDKKVKRIILTRPAVEAGENLGFLPGDLKEKLDPGQIDLPRRVISGLKEALLVLKDVEGVGIIFLDDKDVIRHKLVKAVIKAYKSIENLDS